MADKECKNYSKSEIKFLWFLLFLPILLPAFENIFFTGGLTTFFITFGGIQYVLYFLFTFLILKKKITEVWERIYHLPFYFGLFYLIITFVGTFLYGILTYKGNGQEGYFIYSIGVNLTLASFLSFLAIFAVPVSVAYVLLARLLFFIFSKLMKLKSQH